METVEKLAQRNLRHGDIDVEAGQTFDCPVDLVDRFRTLGVIDRDPNADVAPNLQAAQAQARALEKRAKAADVKAMAANKKALELEKEAEKIAKEEAEEAKRLEAEEKAAQELANKQKKTPANKAAK